MAKQKLILRPGIDVQKTPLLNEGGWSASNLIRFRQGLPEKLGGWQALINQIVPGVVRALHAWADLSANDHLAIGSEQRLQVYTPNSIVDITPIVHTSNLSNPLSTTGGSTTVTVTDATYSPSIGDWIFLPMPTVIDGITLQGFYQVNGFGGGNQYTITSAVAAGSTVASGGTTPEFTSTATSNSIKVTLQQHGLIVGSTFPVQISTSIPPGTLLGNYTVLTVIDGNNFTINLGVSATSSASVFENGGNVQIQYLLPSMAAGSALGTAWGEGEWGEGTWGGVPFVEASRLWSLDNFGEVLLALAHAGELYSWDPSVGGLAAVVTTAPTPGNTMIVAMPQAQVLMGGSAPLGFGNPIDPLLISWTDIGSYTNWTATVTNQAGDFRLSRGSVVVGMLQAPQITLIWTDVDLWSALYEGLPFVYGFNIIGSGCGLIAQNAVATLGANTYWMSLDAFYFYSAGGVQPLPCSVWDEVFTNLDPENSYKCVAAANSLFNEVGFFYPSLSGGTGEIDSYVKYNVLEEIWDYGSLARTAWIDRSVFGAPIGADPGSGFLMQHDVQGVLDANGQAMGGVLLQSSYFDVTDGEYFLFVDQLIPDFRWRGAAPTINISLLFKEWSTDDTADPPTVQGPFAVTPSTQYITFRARGRQMAVQIECGALDTWFRLGAVRFRPAQAGKQ